jgi:hypothetical protein
MRRFFGGLLVALGILIAGLGGLCTLVIVGAAFVDGESFINAIQATIGFARIGSIPIAIGVGLIFAGRGLLKKP